MPLGFVWFQLPNMDIYFNKILAGAAILYIFYFLIQKALLDSYIKEDIPDNKVWITSRFLGVLRLLPIVLIIFAMYNIDNTSLTDGLKYNDCKVFIQKMEWNNSPNKYLYTPNISEIVMSNTTTGITTRRLLP